MLQAYGLDSSLGLMHTDKRYRDSLAHDLIEPVRPLADGLMLELLEHHELRRGDIYETREEVCRLGAPFVRRLAGVGPTFREALTEHARELVGVLLDGTSSPATQPARRRHAHIAGKGASHRAAPRVGAMK